MRNLKYLILVIFMVTGLNVSAQKSGTDLTQEQVKTGLIESFAAFVESVRPFYSKGDTYAQFEQKVLIGNPVKGTGSGGILPTLPPEGFEMLKKAYEYLSRGLTYAQIVKAGNYEVMGKAIIFISNRTKGGSSQYDAGVALFGGNAAALENNPLMAQNKGKCKWWELWCHVDNVLGEGAWNTIWTIILGLINQ